MAFRALSLVCLASRIVRSRRAASAASARKGGSSGGGDALTRKWLKKRSEDGLPGGYCMSGSRAGYYYSQPSSGTSNTWVIFLQGGGACDNKDDCENWNSNKGNSGEWQQTIGAKTESRLSNDPGRNPHFHDAHHVHVPYCTGDCHTGQVDQPDSVDHWGYYFDGHLNFIKIIEKLLTLPDASELEHVLLEGGSAGGKGVFHHCDFLKEFLDKQDKVVRPVAVKCAPRAGWFVPGYGNDRDVDEPPTSWENWQAGQLDPVPVPEGMPSFALQNTFVHEGCAAAHPDKEFLCASVQVMYPFINGPMYIGQFLYDINLIFSAFGMPRSWGPTEKGHEFIQYFGRAMWNSSKIVKAGDGLFMPSCFGHGMSEDPPLANISGHSHAEGLWDWYAGNTGADAVPPVLTDPCSQKALDHGSPFLPCNLDQSCSHAPAVSCSGALDEIMFECSKKWRKGKAVRVPVTKEECLDCAQNGTGPDNLRSAGCASERVSHLCGTQSVWSVWW